MRAPRRRSSTFHSSAHACIASGREHMPHSARGTRAADGAIARAGALVREVRQSAHGEALICLMSASLATTRGWLGRREHRLTNAPPGVRTR
jgi:hypothetical protein